MSGSPAGYRAAHPRITPESHPKIVPSGGGAIAAAWRSFPYELQELSGDGLGYVAPESDRAPGGALDHFKAARSGIRRLSSAARPLLLFRLDTAEFPGIREAGDPLFSGRVGRHRP